MSGSSWPEQDAVDAWFEKHRITAPREAIADLKDDVTKYRIGVQEERDRYKQLYEQGLELIDEAAKLIKAARG